MSIFRQTIQAVSRFAGRLASLFSGAIIGLLLAPIASVGMCVETALQITNGMNGTYGMNDRLHKSPTWLRWGIKGGIILAGAIIGLVITPVYICILPVALSMISREKALSMSAGLVDGILAPFYVLKYLNEPSPKNKSPNKPTIKNQGQIAQELNSHEPVQVQSIEEKNAVFLNIVETLPTEPVSFLTQEELSKFTLLLQKKKIPAADSEDLMHYNEIKNTDVSLIKNNKDPISTELAQDKIQIAMQQEPGVSKRIRDFIAYVRRTLAFHYAPAADLSPAQDVPATKRLCQ